MIKLIITAGVISLLAACSGMGNGSMSSSSGMSGTNTMGASGSMSNTGNKGGGPN